LGVTALIGLFACSAKEGDRKLADQIISKYYSGFDMVPNPASDMARKNPEVVRGIFESTRPEKERLAAYDLYVQCESAGYQRLILSAVKDPSEPIRAAAVHHLRKALSGKELVAEYVRLLGDPSSRVRYNAAEALVDHRCEEAIQPLLKLLADESIETRHRAAWTLLVWKLPEARKRIEQSRHSRNPTVAGVANYGLARFGHQGIDLSSIHTYLEQQLGALTGPPYRGTDDVVGIIWVLGERGDVTSLPVLEEATQHAHSSVRGAAQNAIEQIKRRSRP